MKRKEKRAEKKAQPVKKVERKYVQGTAEELALWKEVCEFNRVYLTYELEREQERHQQICERLNALNGEDTPKAIEADAEELPCVEEPTEKKSEVEDPADKKSKKDMFSKRT